ncbi:YolD-like family protein [Metabacillus idriensis]|uniref:YolD-like family protein n=1 Tax=Metabacillus idriensis TaxID=324768 RepID=UPI001748AAFD|nr:YolD-like family protein [Metabacillus idriensis]
MLRDRGNMKWQGFFMTEHVKLLWDMEEEYLRTARPLLDEGQIEELERLLSKSLQEKSLLEIIIWKKGYNTSRIGTVTKIDRYAKKVVIQDEFDAEIRLNFYDIVDVTVK